MSDGQQAALLAGARRHLEAGEFDVARADFEAALAMGPAQAADYNDYGRVLNNLRALSEARQAFASATALDPGFAEAHNNLGHVLRALNEAEAAADAFRQAVALRPDYVRAWINLGTVLALTGDYRNAIEALQTALALAPEEPDVHLNLAGLYRVNEALQQAEVHLRKVIALSPQLVEARIQLASLLESRGELEEARAVYEAARAMDPVNPEILAGLADVMDKLGRYEEGLALLAPGIAAQPGDPRLAVARARLLRRTGDSESALAVLAAARSANPEAAERLPRYFFTLGELYDELGEFDAAFDSYRRGNQLKQERYDPTVIREAIDVLIRVFTPKNLALAASSGVSSRRPVFIVGMPRSGTSLVEQILASHPRVHGAGELPLLADMVRAMGADANVEGAYPECLLSLTQAQLAGRAKEYLEALHSSDARAARVTDKMPHNFLHLGLIHMLFPRASVIHCVRHPLDTILSCYFQDFASAGMAFSNDLEHLARYYKEYSRLMKHWRDLFPGTILEVRYELLVDATREVAARMLEHTGLEWHENVLEFHTSKRVVKTASHAQVRKPIYQRSLARHVKYEQHLAGARAILGELADPPDL